MVPENRGLVLLGASSMALLALALMVLALAPASAESIDIYEFEEISTMYGANAVAVNAQGSEGVVVWSEMNNTTRLYDNYVFTTSGAGLNQRALYKSQSWYWRSAGYDPSGSTCLMGGTSGILYRYDGSTVTSVSSGIPYEIVDIEWHPTSGTAYLGTSTSRIYQYRSGSISLLTYTTSSVYDMDMRPDGGELAIAAYNYVQLYNISRDEMDTLSRPTDDDGNEYYYVYAVEYAIDGSNLMTNWYNWRQYAMLRFANDRWHEVATVSGQVRVMLFESEGTFSLLGMNNNLQYMQGGSVSPVSDWFSTGASSVNDLAYNTKDFYFLIGTPDGVFKFKRKPNVNPWMDRPIPDLEFEEDVPDGGDNLLDLSVYIRDDRNFDKLRFEMDFEQDPTLIDGEVDGQFLDFTQMVEHWNGRMTFRLKIWDSGGDDIPGSADDLFNRTNFFNVTVRQVNDPVQLISLGEKEYGVDDLIWFVNEGVWLNLSIVTEDVDNYDEEIQPPRFSFNRSIPSLKVDATEMMVTFLPRNKDVGSVYVNMTVTDGFGSFVYAEMVFHVSNVNNPPKLVGIRDRTVKEDNELRFKVSAKDEDLEIGIENYLVFSTNRTDGVGDDDLPNFRFEQDGSDPTRINVTFNPTNEDVGDIYVEFRVSDGFGAPGEWQDVRSMRITVLNTNDAPVLIEVNGVSTPGITEFPMTAIEDKEVSVTLLAHDDDGDSLIYYVDDARFRLSQPGGGNMATITYTPGEGDVGVLFVTVSVWDVFNTFDDLVLNISVQNVNDPPSLVLFEAVDVSDMDQVEYTLYEDVLFTAPIRVVDVDSHSMSFSDSGDIFTYGLPGDPMVAIANFTPTQADVGQLTTILEVDDGDGGSDALVIILTIVGTNDPPGQPEVTQLAFDSLTVPFRATLVTDPDGDTLNYTWDFGDNSPPQSGDSLTDVSHDYPRSGNYQLVLTVDDGKGGVSTATYDVIVTAQEGDPPETDVEEGPVWLVVILIIIFAVMTAVILTLYWKLPRDGGGDL